MKLKIASLLLFFSIAVFAQNKDLNSPTRKAAAYSKTGQFLGLVVAKGTLANKTDDETITYYKKVFEVKGGLKGSGVFIELVKGTSGYAFDVWMKGKLEYYGLTLQEFIDKFPEIVKKQKKNNTLYRATEEYNKTEETSFIKKCNSGQAKTISGRKSVITLHISGGKDPKYSTEDYAKMFRVMFKDKKRTQYPTDIYVCYEESNSNRGTLISAYVGGQSYDKDGGEYEGGDGIFSPKQLLDHIPILTKRFANGTAMRKE